MALFERLPLPSVASAPRVARESAFRLNAVGADQARLTLELRPVGSTADPEVIWSRDCASAAECAAVMAAVDDQGIDPAFLGRQALLLGTGTLDRCVDAIVTSERQRAAKDQAEARERAAAHEQICCYAPEHDGLYCLTLERESASEPEWSIAFRGRPERERLRDWLRWQGERFAEFLAFATEHGAEALEKRLIEEMFKTERRVKSEGLTAGGARPLRMWRGE